MWFLYFIDLCDWCRLADNQVHYPKQYQVFHVKEMIFLLLSQSFIVSVKLIPINVHCRVCLRDGSESTLSNDFSPSYIFPLPITQSVNFLQIHSNKCGYANDINKPINKKNSCSLHSHVRIHFSCHDCGQKEKEVVPTLVTFGRKRHFQKSVSHHKKQITVSTVIIQSLSLSHSACVLVCVSMFGWRNQGEKVVFLGQSS